MIHQHLTDYTQCPSKPDPLPEIRDAPPDETWIEPTIFRNYQYYIAHMNGARQTLSTATSPKSPSYTIITESSTKSRTRSAAQTSVAAFSGNNSNQCEFTITHQVQRETTTSDG